jgi:hypothetical protein
MVLTPDMERHFLKLGSDITDMKQIIFAPYRVRERCFDLCSKLRGFESYPGLGCVEFCQRFSLLNVIMMPVRVTGKGTRYHAGYNT